jgi:hypothetical protein
VFGVSGPDDDGAGRQLVQLAFRYGQLFEALIFLKRFGQIRRGGEPGQLQTHRVHGILHARGIGQRFRALGSMSSRLSPVERLIS